MGRTGWIVGALSVVVVALGASYVFYLSGLREPVAAGGPATFRRLGEEQYVRSIESIFGEGIEIPGRFDPPRRDEGLISVGSSRVVVSRSGFEQAELRARNIAAQVLSEKRRAAVVECDTGNTSSQGHTFDEQCAQQFILEYGQLLYRRPLSSEESASILSVIKLAHRQSADFYTALESGLARMLVSPNFLFRSEGIEADSHRENVAKLDDYSLASRISFLLWDAPPDEELLKAAADGDLQNEKALATQIDRMIASPRFEDGVRAFFSDMFGYDQFTGLTKEQEIFPIYSSHLAEDAKEQTLRTIVDLLVVNNADYRELFTSKKTFLNRRLSALYEVAAPEEAITGWAPYTFSEEDRRAGIFTQAAFLMLDPNHEGRTSPTIRGQAVREFYLCQKVPPPPPAVDFKLVQDTQNENYKTARERLRVHAEVPTCAGCHAITDPIGLSLENYTAVGRYRATENGADIDASGSFEGQHYHNAIEFQQLLSQSATVTDCLAKRVYEYGVGRPVTADEREWMAYLREKFAAENFQLAPLMRSITSSEAFRTVTVEADSSASLALNH